MNIKKNDGFKINREKQKGAIAIAAIGGMVLSVAFIALALDVGRLVVIKNELQNAADAAALAGAAQLSSFTNPAWKSACDKAAASISLNKTEGQSFSSGVVKSGPWNVISPGSSTLTVANCTNNGTPTLSTPFSGSLPAISVTLSRDPSQTPGAIVSVFSKIFGIDSFTLAATSVAGVSYPTSIPGSITAPFAIASCLHNAMQSASAGTIVKIYSVQDNPTDCNIGQWTTFNFTPSNPSTVRELINGTKTPQSIDLNDTSKQTWYPLDMTNGQVAGLFGDMAVNENKIMVVPVVDGAELSRGSILNQNILSFAAFELIDAHQTSNGNQGAGSYLEVRFLKNIPSGTPELDPSSPAQYLGLITSPKLLATK